MKKIWNEEGYSLLLVFFVLVFISIVGISLLTVSATSLKTSDNERTDQSVYYIAEAGLNFKKAEIFNSLSQAEEKAWEKIDELKGFTNPIEAEETYNRIYRTTLESELKRLLLEGKEEITTRYNNFDISDYDSPPHSVVTIGLASEGNGLAYKLESLGEIEGKTRRVITKIEIEPPQIEVHPTSDLPENGSGGENKGDSVNPYEESFFNREKKVKLVVTEKPQKGRTYGVIPVEIESYNSVSDPVIMELNRQYLSHKNACESNDFGDNKTYDSLSSTLKNPLKINLTNNIVYIKNDVSLDKAALTFNSTSPATVIICGNLTGSPASNGQSFPALQGNPAININLFILGENTTINNIGIRTNFLFAPNLDVVIRGSGHFCTTFLVKSFDGNGNGGITSECSKPTLLDPTIFKQSDSPIISNVTLHDVIEE